VRRGYSTELMLSCQTRFSIPKPNTVVWDFNVPVGEGRSVPLQIVLQMQPNENAITLDFVCLENEFDLTESVELILRPDLEDRNVHEITKAFSGPEEQWDRAIQPQSDGFVFAPDPSRKLEMQLKNGTFHVESEWSYMVEHPTDLERGIDGSTDLFSPGYFKINLQKNRSAQLVAKVLL